MEVADNPARGKIKASKIVLDRVKKGAITPAENQAAATVLANSDKDFSCDRLIFALLAPFYQRFVLVSTNCQTKIQAINFLVVVLVVSYFVR
jgi:hypothetical protein